MSKDTASSKTTLRVLAITPFLSRFGLERGLAYLLQHSPENNLRFTVMYFEKKYPDTETSFLEEQCAAHAEQTIHATYTPGNALVKVSRIIQQAIVEHTPDVILCKEWFPTVAAVHARNALRKRGAVANLPVIVGTAENDPEAEFYGGVGNGLSKYLKRFVYRRLYSGSDSIVTVSRSLIQPVQRVFHIDTQKITVIPNGVDPRQIDALLQKPAPFFLPPEHTNLVAFGRLEHQKGFDILIQAFAKALIGTATTLTILGEGSERVKLEEQAVALGVSEQVHFPGYVVNPFPIIKQADAVVFSSRFEGFPFALSEALSTGVPVVSTRYRYGATELLEVDGSQHAFVAEEESVDGLAQAMKECLLQPEEARRRAASARIFVAEHISSSVMVGAYRAHFDELLKKRIALS